MFRKRFSISTTLKGATTKQLTSAQSFRPHERAIVKAALGIIIFSILAPLATARVHSNSMLAMPDNLHLADVDGDGLAEWVGFENDTTYGGYVISIARTDFSVTPLLTIDRRYRITGNTETVFKFFTGHFLYGGRESACIYTNTGHVKCFVIPPGSDAAYWYSDQGAGSFLGREILVGDFDGDGLDEILLYDRWTAAIELWKYNGGTGQFAPVPNFVPGNVADDAGSIAGSPLVLVGDFADFSDGRRDDLLVCNSYGQVVRYDARKDALGRTTFWFAFKTGGGFAACSPYNVSVADVTGAGLESLILRDSSAGSVRFLDMRSLPATGNLATVDAHWFVGSVDQGQIGRQQGYLIWAKMSRWAGESGTNTRDDVFLYGSDTSLSRYDARYYAPIVTYTYWWGYTQYLSNVLWAMFSWATP
jgi:hypothetical protein